MAAQKVLVVGAGVAGSVLAFWLAKSDFEVVVIERSRAEQKAGQGIEIEEPALKVVKEMGIYDKLREKRTIETGFELVDEHSRSYGALSIGDGISPTGALELMRGDLTEVLYRAADEFPNVTYCYQTVIQSIRQTTDKVIVDIQSRVDNGITTEEFDLVVGADGARSRTRQLVMGSPEQINCFKPVGAFVAYFSVPKQHGDGPFSHACHFPDHRLIWLRPVGEDSDVSSAYVIHLANDNPKLRQANASGDRAKQKEAVAELFSGLGWQTPRLMEQMMTTDNFYSDELMQVKLDKWSDHRVVLVGDAAWAPTPFTGQGNQLAIIGGWVLAQELSRNRSMLAFDIYEKRLRKYVESSQNIPLGGYAPYLILPKTYLGIWLFRTVFRTMAWAVHSKLWATLTGYFSSPSDVPEWDFDLQMKTAAS